jgi:hypothetical protein
MHRSGAVVPRARVIPRIVSGVELLGLGFGKGTEARDSPCGLGGSCFSYTVMLQLSCSIWDGKPVNSMSTSKGSVFVYLSYHSAGM